MNDKKQFPMVEIRKEIVFCVEGEKLAIGRLT